MSGGGGDGRNAGRTVVIETGSLSTHAGFAGDEAPAARFDTSESVSDAGGGAASEPFMAYGEVVRTAALEAHWRHTYRAHLGARTEQQPLLLVDSPLITKEAREDATQIAFEKLGVPALYAAPSPVLALYSANKTSGLVVDMGHTRTCVTPVYEGYTLSQASIKLELGGREIEQQLRALVASAAPSSVAGSWSDADWRAVKEQVCAVRPHSARSAAAVTAAPDSEAEAKTCGSLALQPEQYYGAPEILFRPQAMKLSHRFKTSLVDKIEQSLAMCEPEVRHAMYGNVTLVGGSAALPGLDARLAAELVDVAPSDVKVRVSRATDEPGTASWVGGSILASLFAFQQMWATKQEYDEHGPTIMRRKAFNE